MKSWIIDSWLRVRASYWFIPSLMALGAMGASIMMVQIDTKIDIAWLRELGWFYVNQPEGARALLSTVAGSMITVAGVTFSMTLLAVSHASSQIGPRLLTGFMRDQGNQLTLGTFIATFLYCLMVLRTVHTGVTEGQEQLAAVFVPNLAIVFALVSAIISVMVLIYFVHHVPQSISVSNVIASVGDELLQSIQCIYPERVGDSGPGRPETGDYANKMAGDAHVIKVSGDGGYLRVLDTEGLIKIAVENDLVVELQQHPGDFAIAQQPLMRVWPAEQFNDDIEKALSGLCSWGIERTREQDVMFPVEQLLEVLGKAMSPGVNGQYTAVLCLNQFERALAEMLGRSVPDSHRFDPEGGLRIIAEAVSHQQFATGVFRPIRQFIRGDWLVTQHLLNMIERLTALLELQDARALLNSEAAAIRQEVKQGTMVDSEKQLLC